MGLGLRKRKAHLLREGKRYNSLPKNVSILVFFVNLTTFDPSVEPFLAYFPQKTESPPLKKFKGLILGKSIYDVFCCNISRFVFASFFTNSAFSIF
jgi:hypothetical protein